MRGTHFFRICAAFSFLALPALAAEEPNGKLIYSGVTVPGWEASYNGVLTLCTLERHIKEKEYRLVLNFWRNLSRRNDGREIPLIMLITVSGVSAVSPLRVTIGETTVELLRPPALPENYSFGSDSSALEALLKAHKLGSTIKVSFQDKDGNSHSLEVDTLWLEVSAPMFDACAGASPNNKLQRTRGAASESSDG